MGVTSPLTGLEPNLGESLGASDLEVNRNPNHFLNFYHTSDSLSYSNAQQFQQVEQGQTPNYSSPIQISFDNNTNEPFR